MTNQVAFCPTDSLIIAKRTAVSEPEFVQQFALARRASVSAATCVAILLCTRNGAKFLPEQLRSIAAQSHGNWTVYASDDGSKDATLEILARFARDYPGRVFVRTGPGAGATANFMHLATDTSITADYFAFCDQDDVWAADHLSAGLEALQPWAGTAPALYSARTMLISANGTFSGHSPLFVRKPSFNNAVVQSLAGGNTMVFNREARDLAAAHTKSLPVSHDWWMYQLISGVGGHVCYDPRPTVFYRQHDSNVMGANRGFMSRSRRLRMMLTGRFSRWTTENLIALAHAEPLLTAESRTTLQSVRDMRAPGVGRRLGAFLRSRVYRQSLIGTIGLFAAVLLNRV
jgi:glycosyltransferase involved in cell wall biosynthesis